MTRERKYYSKEFKLKAIELSYAHESAKHLAVSYYFLLKIALKKN